MWAVYFPVWSWFAHSVATLGQTESALHFDYIGIILIFYLFSVFVVVLFGLPSFGPDNLMPFFWAKGSVIPRPIYLVYKYPFRIVSDSLIIRIDSFLQANAFIVGIEWYILDSRIAIRINTKIQLCPKLYGYFHFSTHDWPDSSLADTHNPVLHLVNLVFIHVLLLFIKSWCADYSDQIPVFRQRTCATDNEKSLSAVFHRSARLLGNFTVWCEYTGPFQKAYQCKNAHGSKWVSASGE